MIALCYILLAGIITFGKRNVDRINRLSAKGWVRSKKDSISIYGENDHDSIYCNDLERRKPLSAIGRGWSGQRDDLSEKACLSCRSHRSGQTPCIRTPGSGTEWRSCSPASRAYASNAPCNRG